MNVGDVVSVAAAILASLGGAGIIVLGLSGWLGKVWADRLMRQEQAAHEKALEELRDELRRASELELQKIEHHYESETDLLVRRRAVYDRMARAMRVFLQSDRKATDYERREFLHAYDTCYLWASNDVVDALGQFLDLNMLKTKSKDPKLEPIAAALYASAMTVMRRDAGFEDGEQETARYRMVTFGDWTIQEGGNSG